MRTVRRILVCAVAASSWLGGQGAARAQCANANNVGATQLNAAGGPATPAASDTLWSPTGGSYSYAVQDKNVYVVNNGNMAQKWMQQASPASISNFPIPVPLRNNPGKTSVFVASSDAYLKRYDFDPVNGLVLKCTSPQLGRGATCAADTITGTPAVQLYNFSNAAFQASATVNGNDLVYVITHHLCSDTVRNQVVALRASDCQKVWTFNPTGNFSMDYGAEGCTIDYGTNTLYCGTHIPFNHPQPSLWAIDSTSGALKYSWNADSIITRPELRGARLYVATETGSLRARNAADGTEAWVFPITASGSIMRSPWPEPRIAGGINTMVLVNDSNGILHAVTDNGASASAAWTYTPSGSAKVMSAPAVSNIAGKVYVGQNNGQLHQLNAVTGADERYTAAGGASDTVYDPSLDLSSTLAADIDRIKITTSATGAGVSNFKTFCAPWVAGGAAGSGAPVPPPAPEPDGKGGALPPAQPQLGCGTQPAATACVSWTCNATTGVWEQTVAANGTACSDGLACTCDSPTFNLLTFAWSCSGKSDHCQAGVCVGGSTDSTCGSASCTTVGQKGACNHGLSCCGASTGCVNLLTDVHNCGACGNDCDSKRYGQFGAGFDICDNGVCVRNPNHYCGAGNPEESVLNPLASQLRGANNLAFPNTSAGAPCAPAFSVYNTTGSGSCALGFGSPTWNNGIRLVDPETNNKVFAWNETTCSILGGAAIHPFNGAWPIQNFDGNQVNWTLAGSLSNYPASRAGTQTDPGLFLVTGGDSSSRISNHDFESGLTGWTATNVPISGYASTNQTITVLSSGCHGGAGQCVRVGNPSAASPTQGDSDLKHTFTVPAGPTVLDFWYKLASAESNPNATTYDYFEVTLEDASGNVLLQVQPKILSNAQTWTEFWAPISPLAGQSVVLDFHMHNDVSLDSYVVVDDVTLDATAHLDDSLTTSPVTESSAAPFGNLDYNQGVVGPVIDDRASFDNTTLTMYFGDWPSDGYLRKIELACDGTGACATTSSATAPLGASSPLTFPLAGRITAMTFSNFCFGGCTGDAVRVFMTVGTKVYVYEPAWGSGINAHQATLRLFADITDPTLYAPDPSNPQEQPIIGFVSIAADPLYGDLYLEGRDVGGNLEDFVLYVPNTYVTQASLPTHFYNMGDMARMLQLKGQQNGADLDVPYSFTTEGRLGTGGAELIRMQVNGENQNPSFINEPLWP